MTMPKISVVTITYGHEDYIADTLRGVLIQQYDGPIEFIIAEDCSPDNTSTVIEKYFAKNPVPGNFSIKYIRHQKNIGMQANFSWALQRATGKYIAYCEGDDYWTDPLKLQKQVDFMEENENVIACGTYRHILRGERLEEKYPPFKKGDYLINDLIVNNRLPTLSLLYRNDEIEYTSKIEDDISLLLNLAKSGNRLVLLPFVSAIYRYHGAGVNSGKSYFENTAHQFRIKSNFAKEYKNRKFSFLLRKYFISFIWNQFKHILRGRFKSFDIKIIMLSIRYGFLVRY